MLFRAPLPMNAVEPGRGFLTTVAAPLDGAGIISLVPDETINAGNAAMG